MIRLHMATSIWIALIAQSVPSSAQPINPDLAEILASWQARQDRIDRIKYVAQGKAFIPKGQQYKPRASDGVSVAEHEAYPVEDYQYDVELVLSLDFRSNCARKETRGEVFVVSDLRYKEETSICLYDGTHIQQYHPRDENAMDRYDVELYERTEDFSRFFFSTFDYPLFFGHAIFPRPGRRIDPKLGLLIPVLPSLYHVAGRAMQGDRECIVLQTEALSDTGNYHEYWVDMERDAAVTHWESVQGGHPRYVIDVAYERTSYGFLPKHWSYAWYTGDGELRKKEEYDVRETIINPQFSEDLFRVKPKAGMTVFDVGAGREYIEGQPGSDLNILRKRGAGRSLFPAAQIVLGVALACVTGVFLWYRRHRRRSLRQ